MESHQDHHRREIEAVEQQIERRCIHVSLPLPPLQFTYPFRSHFITEKAARAKDAETIAELKEELAAEKEKVAKAEIDSAEAKKKAADQVKKAEKKLAEEKANLFGELESLKAQLAHEKYVSCGCAWRVFIKLSIRDAHTGSVTEQEAKWRAIIKEKEEAAEASKAKLTKVILQTVLPSVLFLSASIYPQPFINSNFMH